MAPTEVLAEGADVAVGVGVVVADVAEAVLLVLLPVDVETDVFDETVAALVAEVVDFEVMLHILPLPQPVKLPSLQTM